MKNETYAELYEQLASVLSSLPAQSLTPVNLLRESLVICQDFLSKLRIFFLDDVFTDTDEIYFFKHVKPKFYARKLFCLECYELEINKPVSTKDTLLNYYKSELTYIDRFFKIHSAAYQYFRAEGAEMDQSYFMRGAKTLIISNPEVNDLDSGYSTQMDYLFAKFISYELLQSEILKQIGFLDPALVVSISPASQNKLGLKWTGKLVNLSELIYGLFYTGQLNNGNVQLSEIVALFERMFMVRIRDVHHTFGEIRERKVSSPSKFLDSMAAAIRDRVDEDLKYKPGK